MSTDLAVQIHKLDVARDRVRAEITRRVLARQYDAAILAINEIRGLDVAAEVLLMPPETFTESPAPAPAKL